MRPSLKSSFYVLRGLVFQDKNTRRPGVLFKRCAAQSGSLGFRTVRAFLDYPSDLERPPMSFSALTVARYSCVFVKKISQEHI